MKIQMNVKEETNDKGNKVKIYIADCVDLPGNDIPLGFGASEPMAVGSLMIALHRRGLLNAVKTDNLAIERRGDISDEKVHEVLRAKYPDQFSVRRTVKTSLITETYDNELKRD